MNVFQHLIVPEDHHIIRQAIQAASEGGSRKYEVRWRTKEGEIIYFSGTTIPRISAQGEFLSTFCSLHDITKRKRMEEALRQSEERYRRLTEGSPDIVWSFSNVSGTLYTSARVKSILGQSPDFLRRNPWFWNESIHPDDKERGARSPIPPRQSPSWVQIRSGLWFSRCTFSVSSIPRGCRLFP
jgi:PAS domain-containing protein